jgi:hypothetical protein
MTDPSDAARSHLYATAGTYQILITGTMGRLLMTEDNASLQRVQSLDQLGEVNMTGIESIFDGCTSITSANSGVCDTTGILSWRRAFRDCTSLATADFSTTDTSNATSFNATFSACSVLDPPAHHFDVSSASNLAFMVSNTSFSNANYDLTLLAWSALTVQSGVSFNASGAQYTEAAARQILTDPPNSWAITDGGPA